MIISRVLFRFGMFKSIPVNKIRQNQIIQKFNNQGDMNKYFEQNRQNMNLINLVSYIRKYTDFMIQKEMMNDNEQMNHAFQVLEQLKGMVMKKEYIKFGDQDKDHKRAFIMLLSLSVEMIQQCPQNQSRFLEYGKLAIFNLKSLDYIKQCNPQELSVFLRCITQIDELAPTEEEEIEYWFLVQKYYPECNGNLCCKYLQSLSKLNTINENIVTGIIDKIAIAKDYNLKDLVSLFGSFKHISEKCPNLMGKMEMIIQEQQLNLVRSNARLDVKQIGMIYNGMFNLNMNCGEGFNEYLMKQLEQQKKLSLLCLAHVFQYHSKKELSVGDNFRSQVHKYLQNYELVTKKDTEKYLMFFHDYIPYISDDFLELNYKILSKAKFNDFGLGKLFSSLTQLKQSDSQIQDLCTLGINNLLNYDQPINVHALNSILRARCILNGSKANQIIETVRSHLERAGQYIINQEFNNLIKKQKYFKSLEFLQVLIDLLKVLEDSIDIKFMKPILDELIKQIQSVKNIAFQQNASRYPDIIKCYI